MAKVTTNTTKADSHERETLVNLITRQTTERSNTPIKKNKQNKTQQPTSQQSTRQPTHHLTPNNLPTNTGTDQATNRSCATCTSNFVLSTRLRTTFSDKCTTFQEEPVQHATLVAMRSNNLDNNQRKIYQARPLLPQHTSASIDHTKNATLRGPSLQRMSLRDISLTKIGKQELNDGPAPTMFDCCLRAAARAEQLRLHSERKAMTGSVYGG